MRIFGLEITRAKGLTTVSSNGFWGTIRESYAGAWQRNVEVESPKNILAFSAVYSCISLIADDIAKLRICLKEQKANGVWADVKQSPFWPVLRKPNRYQTRIQFLSNWVTSKLTNGNTYVYKERNDLRGVVTGLHVLEPSRVTAMVADDGSVWYQIAQDELAGVAGQIVVPSSEIIHDRCVTPFHPLVGVSPIYACGASATQGIRVQQNSSRFFENMSRPSGQLTAPAQISDVTAKRLKEEFERNFSGGNIGRLLVAGDGLKYEGFTIPPVEAQMIEQQKWTVEDVARCFKVPLHMIVAGENPKFSNLAAMNQSYYTQTLQTPIECIELLLDEGLSLPVGMGTELDLSGLLRMDPAGRAEANSKLVGAGILTPNEARLEENLDPLEGGDTAYLQQQQYSLAALAKRDAQEDPFNQKPPALAPVAPPADEDKAFRRFMENAQKKIDALWTA